MSNHPLDVSRQVKPGVFYAHYDLASTTARQHLLEWRDICSHEIDLLLPSFSELAERQFNVVSDRYQVGDIVFADARAGGQVLERSLTRISRDRLEGFVFHVFLEGCTHSVSVRPSGQGATPRSGCIFVRDMAQPVRMQRTDYRSLTFAVPTRVVAEVLPEPDMLHGQMLSADMPGVRLLINHVAALGRSIPNMDAEVAASAMRSAVHLLVAGLCRQARLSGGVRAAARAAMASQVRRYVGAHLYESSLTPDTVLTALGLPRRTVYRLFEQDGGLGAYIVHRRLRQAGMDLLRMPNMPVGDIAYGLGFRSTSDFARAFHRYYLMAPRDFRVMGLMTH